MPKRISDAEIRACRNMHNDAFYTAREFNGAKEAMMTKQEEISCIRCRRIEQIEEHHIVECLRGGSDAPENKELRCQACHKYEHTWRRVKVALEYERGRGQANRIRCYEHRLEVLEGLNTPKLIRERGTYLSYWIDRTTRYLPRRIPTKQEAKVDRKIKLALSEAMVMELKV